MLRLQATTTLLAALFLCAAAALAQQQSFPQQSLIPGTPTSGGYQPPQLSLDFSLRSDKTLAAAVWAYAQSADSDAFRGAIESAAASGNIGAQILLAEQYIPEQCALDPNHDVPDCSPDGKHNPKVIFRTNPLDLPASYEDAAHWLERASAQGSGEASEMLAQLITRMLSNGHPTPHTAADSTRLHVLARTQGFDLEPLSVSCYQLTPPATDAPAPQALTFAGPQRELLTAGAAPLRPFSAAELETLQAAGALGTLHFTSMTNGGESAFLSRPSGLPAHIHVILDHDPGHEIHLSIPAHHDVIYLQHGDGFVMLPSGVATLPRFLSIMPQRRNQPQNEQQVSIFVQQMSGAYSGTFCARF